MQHLQKTILTLLLFCFTILGARAGNIESYIQTLTGNLKQGDTCTVIDDKFKSLSADEWGQIQHLKVDNLVTFEIRFDTTINFYNKPFTCTLNVTIEYFTTQAQEEPTRIENVSMQVQFDTTIAKAYKGIATYRFNGAHHVKVIVNSISCPEYSSNIPAIFRVKNQIIVERKYPFVAEVQAHMNYSITGTASAGTGSGEMMMMAMSLDPVPSSNDRKIIISWDNSDFPGSEWVDIEWTFVDEQSTDAPVIAGALPDVPLNILEGIFLNNSTRVTLLNSAGANSYTINYVFPNGYLLARVRGATLDGTDQIRHTTNWNYEDDDENTMVLHMEDGHEENFNWQYSAAFAEEGKRKEVVSYLDGTLRGRQAVTLNNSDDVAVVQESIYDIMGRPMVSVMPAPTPDNTLHYYGNFNQNGNGSPYSFRDITINNSCLLTADPMSNADGAQKYYSEANPFTQSFTKYIPKAQGYPFMVTEYMPDNTGRIKQQSGVGLDFKPGSGHETKYFYGKPDQEELDRLFGSEAGISSHYQKTMVRDPNGQLSVSYTNASGKTIATALAGASPENLAALPSNNSSAIVPFTRQLINPNDLEKNSADLSVKGHTTFLATTPGTYHLDFSLNPMRLEVLHGENNELTICSDCYYDVLVQVKRACGDDPVEPITIPAGLVFNTDCNNVPDPVTGSLDVPVTIDELGEYYVSYSLVVSKPAMDFFDNFHIENNTSLKKLEEFFTEDLRGMDFTNCFNDCQTCKVSLGQPADFLARFEKLYDEFDLTMTEDDITWVNGLYTTLLANCNSLPCNSPCADGLEAMKADVMPGGQYALYDPATFALLQPTINVLQFYRTTTFHDENGQPEMVTDSDGELVAPNTLPQDEFIQQYLDHPHWAADLVTHHPEYCFYEFCISNTNSFAFDKKIEAMSTAAEAAAHSPSLFNGNINALVDNDPLFNGGGAGASLKSLIQNDLFTYSNKVKLTMSSTTKNVLQTIDWMLYCRSNTLPGGWTGCTVDPDCRAEDREWQMYRQFYLDLKQRYYEQLRREQSCSNCHIGQDLVPNICPPLSTTDFSTNVFMPPVNTATCPAGGVEITYTGSLIREAEYLIDVELNVTGGGTVIKTVELPIGATTVYYCFQSGESFAEIDKVYCKPGAIAVNSNCTPNTFDCGSAVVGLGTLVANSAPCTGAGVFKLSFTYSGPLPIPDGVSIIVHYDFQDNSFPTPQQITGQLTINNQTGIGFTCLSGYSLVNGFIAYETVECHDERVLMPSECAGDPLYAQKSRIYNAYVDELLLERLSCQSPSTALAASEALQRAECKNGCEAMAESWVDRLKFARDNNPDFASITDQNILNIRNGLISLCKQGCDIAGPVLPDGASTLPSGDDFEDIFIAETGLTNVRKGFSAELLNLPYPHNKQPVLINPTISESDANICSRLASFKTLAGTTDLHLVHLFLQDELGRDYKMTEDELIDLNKSCNECNFILNKDITIPIAFVTAQPANTDQPYTNCTRISDLLTEFNTLYTLLSVTDVNYETIFTNFFNHRLGYNLTYGEYQQFLAGCPSAVARLYNQPLINEVPYDDNACLAELFTSALTRSNIRYKEYIEEERRKFRNNYLAKCFAAKPSLTLTTNQHEYHYTLYYYDQSGNLVKTIPPEGVDVLTPQEVAQVQQAREYNMSSCSGYTGPTSEDKAGTLTQLSQALQNSGNRSVEMWLYSANPANGHQVIAATTDRAFMYHTCISGGKITVEVYSIDEPVSGALEINLTNRASADISYMWPLPKWMHVVAQGTGMAGNPLALFVNGQSLTLLPVDNPPNLSICQWEINSANLSNLPENLATVKHLRIYNRLMTGTEILENYRNGCFTPSVGDYAWWGRFNIPAAGSETTIGPGSTVEANDLRVFPAHRMATLYTYNSLNKVATQSSPDGGTTHFWYDRVGRLIISQNSEQAEPSIAFPSNYGYSYTRYDQLGRVAEVGLKSLSSVNTSSSFATPGEINSSQIGTGHHVTKTIYDDAPIDAPGLLTNLRMRVASTETVDEGGLKIATYYSYDISGNIKTLYQRDDDLISLDPDNGLKRIDYEYDLVSGNINLTKYQEGKGDQFFYKNLYDAENRMISAQTSRDGGTTWMVEAEYEYYLHGPMARTELGAADRKAQGIDYAYTLKGWLKGVNNNYLNPDDDMGLDGNSSTSPFARDVFGFTLHYFGNDYIPIRFGQPGTTAFRLSYTQGTDMGQYSYNGNIAATTVVNKQLSAGLPQGYFYGHDQLNRLLKMRLSTTVPNSPGTWTGGSFNASSQYGEDFAYDGNGNIKSVFRFASQASGSPPGIVTNDMDALTYHYKLDGVTGQLMNNKLSHVDDAVPSEYRTNDLDDQSYNNYIYDKIGNLIVDAQEGIEKITWNIYRKIEEIEKTSGSGAVLTRYKYNAGGNRVNKFEIIGSNQHYTFYIRDVRGDVLSIYRLVEPSLPNGNPVHLFWSEQHLYGNSRIGTWRPDIEMTPTPPSPPASGNNQYTIGDHSYELTNHLGNVLAVISDKKIGVDVGENGSIDYYNAEILNASDYYAFGMSMPGRNFNAGNYRYGFNGKENDNLIKGDGNQQDYGMRIYDPRLGRFLSVDPLSPEYPWYSPYHFAGNMPIRSIDIDGLEPSKNPPNVQVQAGWNRVSTIKNLFNETGGEKKYRENYANIMEGGSYVETGDANINTYVSDAVQEDAEKYNHKVRAHEYYLMPDKNFDEKTMINFLLGTFITGEGPENIIFPVNGIMSNYMLKSHLLQEALNDFYRMNSEALANKDYQKYQPYISSVSYKLMNQIDELVDRKTYFTIPNYAASYNISIVPIQDELSITIFNITSVTSGDPKKHFEWWNPVRSNVRLFKSITPFGNISQTFQLRIPIDYENVNARLAAEAIKF